MNAQGASRWDDVVGWSVLILTSLAVFASFCWGDWLRRRREEREQQLWKKQRQLDDKRKEWQQDDDD